LITYFYTLYICYQSQIQIQDWYLWNQYIMNKWNLSHKIMFKECDLTLPLNIIPGQYLYVFLVKHKYWFVNFMSYYNSLLNPLQLRHNISIIHSSSHPSMLHSFMVSLFVYSCASGWPVFLRTSMCIYWPTCHMCTNRPQCHLSVQTWLPYCCTSETYKESVLFRRYRLSSMFFLRGKWCDE